MSPVTRWQEHPPGCDCAPCERRQAAIAMNRAYLRQLAEAETEEEQERLLSRAEAAGRFLQAIAGPFSVLAVDTPASRGEVPQPEPPDPAEALRAEIFGYEALDAYELISRIPDHPEGTCRECHLGPLYANSMCWYCDTLDDMHRGLGDMLKAQPDPPRDRESRGWHRTHAQLTVDSFLLGMGLVFIIVGSHLVPWLGIPGLFCLIWAALPWKRWRP